MSDKHDPEFENMGAEIDAEFSARKRSEIAPDYPATTLVILERLWTRNKELEERVAQLEQTYAGGAECEAI